MRPEARLRRIKAADAARVTAAAAAAEAGVSTRDVTHPLRKAHRKAALRLADELRAGMEDGVSLAAAAVHLGVSREMLRQRLSAAERMRRGEQPWPTPWARRQKAS